MGGAGGCMGCTGLEQEPHGRQYREAGGVAARPKACKTVPEPGVALPHLQAASRGEVAATCLSSAPARQTEETDGAGHRLEPRCHES